jgi:hypothetical protein
VLSKAASISGSPVFKFRPEDRYPDRTFVVSLSQAKVKLGQYLKLGHVLFLEYILYNTLFHHHIIILYIV